MKQLKLNQIDVGSINDHILYITVIILILFFILNQVSNTQYLFHMFDSKSLKHAYVSDEIYYVSSARNTLAKIFKVRCLKTNGNGIYFTLFINNIPPKSVLNNLSKRYHVEILDSNYSRSHVITIIVTINEAVSTFYKHYGGANAIYVRSCCMENIISFIKELSLLNYTIIDVIPGWAYPDKPEINNYFNLEHPPLGKYIIALSILILGDYPVGWRIPSIIATVIIFIFSYLITVEILRGFVGYRLSKWVSLLVPFILFFDSSLRTVGVLAMLDPYVALFTIIGVYFFVREKNTLYDYAKKISWILAGLSKFSGLFIVPADLVEKTIFNTVSTKQRLKILIKEISIYLSLYVIFLLVFSLPLIMYIGFNEWFKQSIIDAFKWHTRTKHALTSGPPTTSPFDWLFGWNAFPLWYDPKLNKYIKCTGLPPIYLVSFILNLLFAPLMLRYKRSRRIWLSTYSIWLMYMILYALGNRSLYSFYIIQFSPLLIIQFIVCIILLYKHLSLEDAWLK